MTGADEQELRGRLDTALMTITPRPAPIDTVMRQGRHLVYRRRISAAGGLAAVAVAAVAVPAALNQHTAGPALARLAVAHRPPARSRFTGRPYRLRDRRRHALERPRNPPGLCRCVRCREEVRELHHPGRPCRPHRPRQWGPHHGAGAGRARRDTGYGQAGRRPLLVLHPVRADGRRWVAFPVPAGTGVLRVTAYAGRAELSHVIPFTNPAGPSNLPTFNVWLAPGAAGHPRVTTRLGAGIVEYAGPWGRCITTPISDGSSAFCNGGFGSELRNGQPVSVLVAPTVSDAPPIYLATAAAQVSRVTVSVSDGRLLRPAIIRGADGEKFFTYTVGRGQKALRWTAYGADGQRLGSGSAGLN